VSDGKDDFKDEFLAALQAMKEKGLKFAERRFEPPPIVHNPQHDIESVWWITLWSLTGRVDHLEAEEYASAVFQISPRSSASRRRVLLSSDATFQYTLESVLPPSLSPFVRWMVLLRKRLLYHYSQRAYNNDLFVKGSYGRLHTSIHNFFSPTILEAVGSDWQSVELVVDNPHLESSVGKEIYPALKRPQPDSDHEDEDSSRKKSKMSGQHIQTAAAGDESWSLSDR